VTNARGTVAQDDGWEYHYVNDSQRPTFTPSHAGTYTLHLSADLVLADPLFPTVLHAENDVDVVADGPTISSGGCSVGRTSPATAFALLGMLVALGFIRRRRA
jgi:MYXO-CTERM domain-containing protein